MWMQQSNLSSAVEAKKRYLRVAGAVVGVCESDSVVMSLRRVRLVLAAD
jgi:hypothetical protein